MLLIHGYFVHFLQDTNLGKKVLHVYGILFSMNGWVYSLTHCWLHEVELFIISVTVIRGYIKC